MVLVKPNQLNLLPFVASCFLWLKIQFVDFTADTYFSLESALVNASQDGAGLKRTEIRKMSPGCGAG